MTYPMLKRLFTVKILNRAAFTVLSLSSIAVAHSQSAPYHTPTHNFHQNNWMAGGGG